MEFIILLFSAILPPVGTEVTGASIYEPFYTQTDIESGSLISGRLDFSDKYLERDVILDAEEPESLWFNVHLFELDEDVTLFPSSKLTINDDVVISGGSGGSGSEWFLGWNIAEGPLEIHSLEWEFDEMFSGQTVSVGYSLVPDGDRKVVVVPEPSHAVIPLCAGLALGVMLMLKRERKRCMSRRR